MKTTIIAILAVLCSITVSAQEFTVKSSSHGFNMENSTKTSQYLSIQSDNGIIRFELYSSKTGSLFVKGVSAQGKDYPIWVGTPTTMKYQGNTVYQFKSGSYAVFTIGNNGYPKAIYLDKSK